MPPTAYVHFHIVRRCGEPRGLQYFIGRELDVVKGKTLEQLKREFLRGYDPDGWEALRCQLFYTHPKGRVVEQPKDITAQDELRAVVCVADLCTCEPCAPPVPTQPPIENVAQPSTGDVIELKRKAESITTASTSEQPTKRVKLTEDQVDQEEEPDSSDLPSDGGHDEEKTGPEFKTEPPKQQFQEICTCSDEEAKEEPEPIPQQENDADIESAQTSTEINQSDEPNFNEDETVLGDVEGDHSVISESEDCEGEEEEEEEESPFEVDQAVMVQFGSKAKGKWYTARIHERLIHVRIHSDNGKPVKKYVDPSEIPSGSGGSVENMDTLGPAYTVCYATGECSIKVPQDKIMAPEKFMARRRENPGKLLVDESRDAAWSQWLSGNFTTEMHRPPQPQHDTESSPNSPAPPPRLITPRVTRPVVDKEVIQKDPILQPLFTQYGDIIADLFPFYSNSRELQAAVHLAQTIGEKFKNGTYNTNMPLPFELLKKNAGAELPEITPKAALATFYRMCTEDYPDMEILFKPALASMWQQGSGDQEEQSANRHWIDRLCALLLKCANGSGLAGDSIWHFVLAPVHRWVPYLVRGMPVAIPITGGTPATKEIIKLTKKVCRDLLAVGRSAYIKGEVDIVFGYCTTDVLTWVPTLLVLGLKQILKKHRKHWDVQDRNMRDIDETLGDIVIDGCGHGANRQGDPKECTAKCRAQVRTWHLLRLLGGVDVRKSGLTGLRQPPLQDKGSSKLTYSVNTHLFDKNKGVYPVSGHLGVITGGGRLKVDNLCINARLSVNYCHILDKEGVGIVDNDYHDIVYSDISDFTAFTEDYPTYFERARGQEKGGEEGDSEEEHEEERGRMVEIDVGLCGDGRRFRFKYCKELASQANNFNWKRPKA